jgi:RIO kinase 1
MAFFVPCDKLGHKHHARGLSLSVYMFSPFHRDEVSEKEEVLYGECSFIFSRFEYIDFNDTYKEHILSMSKRKQFRAMDELEEQEIQAQQDPVEIALDYFLAEGMITEILYPVKRGKEATVYCCQAHASTGMELLAAKIYRPRNHRGFKNDAIYQEGRVITNGQVRRAVQKKSRFGRQMQFGMWVNYEFDVLMALHHAGADVPQPIARTQSAILMEYFGDHEQAAPSLGGSELSREQARAAFDSLLSNIELWLAHNYVHGDLSAYNVLYWQGQAKIIDFPQAVDPRFNSNAFFLLTRDIENICHHLSRYDLVYDGTRIAERLWQKFRNAQL